MERGEIEQGKVRREASTPPSLKVLVDTVTRDIAREGKERYSADFAAKK